MLLEQRTVSRKTPGDGRLEITKRAAARLGEVGASFAIDFKGKRSNGSLVSIPCTCRGAENPHEHYFIEDAAFRDLKPGTLVDLELESDGRLVRLVER